MGFFNWLFGLEEETEEDKQRRENYEHMKKIGGWQPKKPEMPEFPEMRRIVNDKVINKDRLLPKKGI